MGPAIRLRVQCARQASRSPHPAWRALLEQRTRCRDRRTRQPLRPDRAAGRASGVAIRRAAVAHHERQDRDPAQGIAGAIALYSDLSTPPRKVRAVGAPVGSPLLFRGQLLGKYKIIAPLGSGGFGTVYLAQDTWIDKKVAIKVPHRQGLDFGEMLREPRLLASVSHPNIVAITTAEKTDNVFFIVMEYVQGETLENIIAMKGPLELNRALDFTCQICNAVDHAHRQGVIHRDLRPANVLVTENDVLKVADFGTSRFLEIAAHGTTVIGSPPYMAPEQFHGKAVFASDIYSLGVTMYQMLTGVLPYDTPAPADLERLMSGELVSPPRLKNPGIPKAINDIIMRAMAPELTARYQRATDLLADILAARAATTSRRTPPGAGKPEPPASRGRDDAHGIQARLRPRETPAARFCWQCRKPLHARTDQCPFCGERQ
jgi:eukaryotic-like serine/threonine-protein kinase